MPTPEASGRLSTSVRRKDIWDHLGNFCELQLVDRYLENHGPIITLAIYPNDLRNQIDERRAQFSRSFWSGQLKCSINSREYPAVAVAKQVSTESHGVIQQLVCRTPSCKTSCTNCCLNVTLTYRCVVVVVFLVRLGLLCTKTNPKSSPWFLTLPAATEKTGFPKIDWFDHPGSTWEMRRKTIFP